MVEYERHEKLISATNSCCAPALTPFCEAFNVCKVMPCLAESIICHQRYVCCFFCVWFCYMRCGVHQYTCHIDLYLHRHWWDDWMMKPCTSDVCHVIACLIGVTPFDIIFSPFGTVAVNSTFYYDITNPWNFKRWESDREDQSVSHSVTSVLA